jgi:hypothetical protein
MDEADRMSQILRWAGLIVAITIFVAAVVIAGTRDILRRCADVGRRTFSSPTDPAVEANGALCGLMSGG